MLVASCCTQTYGCATYPRVRDVRTCIADPRNNALHCDGETKAWGIEFEKYVCHPLDQYEAYMRGCK